MRRLLEFAALLGGILAGHTLAAAVAGPMAIPPADTPLPGPIPAQAVSPETTTTTASDTSTPESAGQIYLVWATGGLPQGFPESVADMFQAVSLVRGDPVELEIGGGEVVPLDAVALDPEAHGFMEGAGSLQDLVPGTVGLSRSSAGLRALDIGDEVAIDGGIYQVVAIAPDEVVGAAEIVFALDDPASPVATDRYLLLYSDLPRPEVEEMVRAQYDGPAPLRIRVEGETPWLRHGDAVLPQIYIKEALGEFSYRDRTGASFVQDPEFVESHIVRAEVPVLGEVVCHEVVVEMLTGAMSELVESGLTHLVDPAQFAGCWNPRFIRAATGVPSGVSRHAWGAAVDLNVATNPVGSVGSQDPRLVAIMKEWGFTWGGEWLVPDPMHFEYGIPPRR